MKGGLLEFKKEYELEQKETARLEIVGFRSSFKDQALVLFLSVLTLGFLQLVLYWRPDWRLRLTHKACALNCADKLLIKDEYGTVHVTSVVKDTFSNAETNEACIVAYFVYKETKYIFNDETDTYFPLRGFPEGTSCAALYERVEGLRTTEAEHQKHLFGANKIDVPVKPILWLLMHEVLNPFYIFQVYSCVVWFAQWYWQYTSAILFLSLMSICVTIYETRKQSRALRDQVKTFSVVKVYRDQEWKGLSSTELVPGDVIEVPANGTIDCDAVLLDGVVIMNESMLTGESVPETKTPLPDDNAMIYLSDVHKRHTLFCGTSVVQTSGTEGRTARALVLRTGFSTAKGELVRSILYPKPVDQKLYNDGMKLCIVSAMLGLVAVVYTSVMFAITDGTTLFAIIINALDIITFVVPASLPAMLTIGTIYAQRRLEKAGIYCLSSKYINLSGTLDAVCFDKTGTLTADELSLYEVVPARDGVFCEVAQSVEATGYHGDGSLGAAMALCNSLVKVDGRFVGDSLDVALFEASNWEFIEATEELAGQMTYGRKSSWFLQPKPWPSLEGDTCDVPAGRVEDVHSVVHQYPFSSEFQRMGVVVQRALTSDLTLYMKGAPEKIADLCDKSTVPDNLKAVLKQYTRQGFRVICVAYKTLDSELATMNWRKIARNDVECNLTFLGLCILRNDVKPGTTESLAALQSANIRTIMVTGDNLFTAVHVARECGMVSERDSVTLVEAVMRGDVLDVTRTPFDQLRSRDVVSSTATAEEEKHQTEDGGFVVDVGPSTSHNALDGKTFELLQRDPVLFDQVIERATIFGRMLPDQKATLVEKLQGRGYRVGMCGDGANDCAALKTADTGVSLCNTEASVAAPFTSKTQDISCMPLLMREGRCALATSFSLFKTLFGACWVECVAVLILARISNDMADAQYLYIDMAVIVAPTLFFGSIAPCKYLSPQPPPASLTCFETLASLLTFIGLQTVYLAGMWTYLHAQPWVTEWKYNYDDVTSYQNSTMFIALNVAILLPPLLFFYGPPYQKRMYTNKMLCVCLVVLGVCCALLMFPPWNFLVNAFSLKIGPAMGYYGVLAMFAVLNFAVSIFVESIVINKLCHMGLVPLIKQLVQRHQRYTVRRKQQPENVGTVDEELCAVDVFQ